MCWGRFLVLNSKARRRSLWTACAPPERLVEPLLIGHNAPRPMRSHRRAYHRCAIFRAHSFSWTSCCHSLLAPQRRRSRVGRGKTHDLELFKWTSSQALNWSLLFSRDDAWSWSRSSRQNGQRSDWLITPGVNLSDQMNKINKEIKVWTCNVRVLHLSQTYLADDRRKFRSQTSDNMDRWKAEQGRGREKRKIRREKSRRERVRRKKMQMCEKVRKSRNTVFFQWFVAPEGRKVGSLKRRVQSQLARGEMKNCTPLWREAHFQVKMYKTHHVRTTFGSWDVEKVHAVVARSTFPSHNVQNTPFSDHFWKLWCRKVHAVVARSTFPSENVQQTPRSDHFWKLRCRKSARRCGAKHISKSKCTKHTMHGPFLEVQMSFRVAGASDCAPGQKWAKREGFVAFSTTTTPHYTPIHCTTTTTTPSLHSTTLNSTTLHCTQLH